MTRTVVALVALALVLAAPATAKGPSRAIMQGPGLAEAGVVLDAEAAMQVMEQSGFWPATYEQTPNPLLAARPKGDLGPRYVIAYELPRIVDVSVVRQDVYPFAPGGPVTHVSRGQMLFDRPTTGGWFRPPASFKRTLVSLGVPEQSRKPTTTASPTRTSAWTIVPVLALLALVLPVVAIRRRR